MIGLEPQHVLARTHRRSNLITTCRRKRPEIRPEKLRFQQPGIGLIASAIFNRRSFLNESKCVKPRRRSAGYESVAARRRFGRRQRRQARYPSKGSRKGIDSQRRLGHPRWEIETGFPCLRGIHCLGFLSFFGTFL